jgi:acyl carrier protein
MDRPADLDEDRPLAELGLDSLMALELKNGLQQSSGMRLPPSFMFEYPTISSAAVYLNAIIGPARSETNEPGSLTQFEDIPL